MGNQNTLKNFNEQQKKATNLLNKLNSIVKEGLDLGVEFSLGGQNKLESVVGMIQNGNRLKVALIGGFSEGKTTIAAAWMEKYDTSSMKISQQESSDEVCVYVVDDEIELIDTPGLFGLKEKYNIDLGSVEKYKDITKKYVSEAHLVLYVMDSANPIKESHQEDLLWLFRTLGLLPRTIFVLSRFDEVADIGDDEDYRENLIIKKANVLGRLTNILSLSEEEVADIQIVGVVANPFGMGLDYWLENRDEFKRISRIETLQMATAEAINHNGGYFPIVYEMQKSVIRDILETHMENVMEQCDTLSEVLEKYRENCESFEKDLSEIGKKIQNAQSSLTDFIIAYFGDLMLQVRGSSLETIQEFIDVEIGKDGCVMYAKIENKFRREIQIVNGEIERAQVNFSADMNQFDSTILSMGKTGFNMFLKGSVFTNNDILNMRNGVVSVANKYLRVDLGKYLKFQPWGAVKLANTLTTVTSLLGTALDLWKLYKQHEAEETFRNAKEDLGETLDSIRQGLLEMVKSSTFIKDFFSDYIKIKDLYIHEMEKIKECDEKNVKIQKWCEKVECFAVESNKLI